MGWRDINMNRRKPRLDVAVVPVEAGEDAASAVLRKACRAALDAAIAQGGAAASASRPLIAGYLAGYARHQALKHALDAERDQCAALAAALAAAAPEDWKEAVAALRFEAQVTRRGWGRSALCLTAPLADAGYILGHLESLCGTRRLLAMALKPGGDAAAADAFLTACDVAADRMQTHHPTAALRLDAEERAVLRAALSRA